MNRIFVKSGFAFILIIWALQVFPCTTFIITGKATPDGKPVLFKNRDTDQMQNSLVVFNDGRYKYIGLVNGDHEWNTMVWGGFNEAGFAIINSAAYNNNIGDTTRFMDQEGVIMKMALQNCRTLEDFEILLDTLPKPMGLDANFGVIDAFGGASYYETGNYSYVKFDANNPEIAPDGILVRTNHSISADLTKGFGFCRYNTAVNALHVAASSNILSPQYLFNNLSRNLTHSLTKTDLLAEIPAQRDVVDFRFFIDFIPRESTSSAIMIIGTNDYEKAGEVMMWSILGFPLTSIALPAWITPENRLPKAVSPDEKLESPVCKAALLFKDECFPIKHDRGWNYIDLSKVINRQNTGYMQLLQPVEDEIFFRTNQIMSGIKAGTASTNDIYAHYDWIDNFLSAAYSEKFNVRLFND